MTGHRVAILSMMGHRSRMAVLGELFSGCQSLLDDLTFFSMWQGSQCIDMVSGMPLANSASLVLPGDDYGIFIAASSQFLQLPSRQELCVSDTQCTIGCWYYLTAKPASTQYLISKYSNTDTKREFFVSIASTGIPGITVSNDGTNVLGFPTGYVSILSSWNCVMFQHDPGRDQIVSKLNGYPAQRGAYSSNVFVSDAPLRVGAIQTGGYFNGNIGTCAMWKRLLSDREQDAFTSRRIRSYADFVR